MLNSTERPRLKVFYSELSYLLEKGQSSSTKHVSRKQVHLRGTGRQRDTVRHRERQKDRESVSSRCACVLARVRARDINFVTFPIFCLRE